MSTNFAHDDARSIRGCFADVSNGVTETNEEIRKDLDDVGFEEATESGREGFKCEEGALSVLRVLLVFDGGLQRTHYVTLLQGRNTTPFDNTGETISSSSSLGIFF